MAERGGTATDLEIQSIQNEWNALAKRLAPILRAEEDTDIRLTPEEQKGLLVALEAGKPHDEVARMVASWVHAPVSKELVRIADQASWLAKRLGKGELDVTVEGGNFRLDTHNWKSFYSSLSHIVRNAIDHGLETAEERAAAGKAERANLKVRAFQDALGVTLEIVDDGRGIDWDKVREVAERKGLPHLTQDDLQDALFADGLSTRDQASELSGRGVGMAAVKQSVTELNGRIDVSSVKSRGTTFRFFIPRQASVVETPVAARQAG